MQLVSKLYKSADITNNVLGQLIEDFQEGDVYGYFLIENKLVPKSFVNKLNHHLCDFSFEYGDIWSIQELLGDEFWLSLNDDERSVAGACVLIVLENNYSIAVPENLIHKH